MQRIWGVPPTLVVLVAVGVAAAGATTWSTGTAMAVPAHHRGVPSAGSGVRSGRRGLGAAAGTSAAVPAGAAVPGLTGAAVPGLAGAAVPATPGPVEGTVAGVVSDPRSGGYWEFTSTGQVFNFTAPYQGSMASRPLNDPVVGMAATPTGNGYWLVASDGGIFSFGAATFRGSMGLAPLNQPVVAIAADPATGGYWEVAADGGIFAFTAPFLGSTGTRRLNEPVVGMAATPTGDGYWLVASDGGVFSYGAATFHGSQGAVVLNRPVVGIGAGPSAAGYWLVASDGGIFSFGVPFEGSLGSQAMAAPVTSMAVAPTGAGYLISTALGGVYADGAATGRGTVAGLAHAGGGHPYIPPQDPPANIAPDPDYRAAAACRTPAPGLAPAPGCLTLELAATDAARSDEGLAPMVLPAGFSTLSQAEQLFVVVDLERVARGEQPVLGLAPGLDATAQSAAASGTDPVPVPGELSGASWWGSTYVAGALGPLDADYVWLYQDGWGGSGQTTNLDCTGPGAPACWGHRDVVLSPQHGVLVMGAGVAAGSELTGVLVAYGPTAPAPALSYTWAQALAAGAGG